MELQQGVIRVFGQLTDSLRQLSGDQYVQACKNLSGNTIGEHVRHVIEMFQCLENGYQNGVIDYEKRKRDHSIETHKSVAVSLLQEITAQISKANKPLTLVCSFDGNTSAAEKIETNYFREIAYNLEHTIHHMALIRVGLREVGPVDLAPSYGVASSTIKYREQCAQ